jgi:protein Mpv17
MICSSRAVPRLGRRIVTPPPPLHTWQIPRRCNASKADTQYPTAPTAKSIPGPSWLWLEPIYEPFRAYGRVQQRRPYTTQVVSALVVYFVGDLVAQEISIEKRQGEATAASTVGSEDDVRRGWRVVEWAEGRDWWRTGRALLIGGAAAVPGYRWFLWLGNSFNYRSKVLSLATKVRRDAICLCCIE